MANNSVKDFEISGVDDLISFLLKLTPAIEKRMLDQSVSAAVKQGFSTPIKKNVRQVVKKRTGNLLKGVKVSKIKGAPPGSYRVFMGPPGYHAHLIEYGTVQKRRATRSKTGKSSRVVKFGDEFRMVDHTGGVSARPFFRPGVLDNRDKAADKLRVQLVKRMDKYISSRKK